MKNIYFERGEKVKKIEVRSQTALLSEDRMLGDELIKRGGFWQVDMGGIATINIPRGFEFDIDQIMEDLGLRLSEIE